MALGRKGNEALLERIRKNFDYETAAWREIREERRKDMLVIAGDIWPADERSARTSGQHPRLALDLDEVGQYVNSCVNEMRMASRGIKVTPKGDGANDEQALLRAGIIKGIEYESKADRVYANAYQAAVEGSFGFWKLKSVYESENSLDQVLRICVVDNPETILLDSSAKELDYSDAKHGFEIERFTEDEFRKRWPKAEIQSFSSQLQVDYPSWITGTTDGKREIQVCSYWECDYTQRKLVLMEDGTKVFMDEIPEATFEENPDDETGRSGFVTLPDGRKLAVVDWADKEKANVCQYITNGIEILEKNPWDGPTIPIYPVFGKRIWVNKGIGSKLVILSLVRLARPAVLLYCYCRTAQAELCGQQPKTPFIGAEGQFATNTPWDDINRLPLGYAEYKPVVASAPGVVLPPPQRNQWEAPIQALEVLAVAAQRAIQAAMGITGLLNGQRGQDRSAKSGVALREMDKQTSQSTYHFIDSLEAAIERCGKEINMLLPIHYDQPRDVAYVAEDEEPAMLSINKPGLHPQTQQPIHFNTNEGDFGVTISTGPSYESQRVEAQDFINQITQIPGVFQRVGDLLVKLQNLGPIGNAIADRLAPPDAQGNRQLDPQAAQIIQQLKAELDAAHSFAQSLKEQMDAKIPELKLKKYTVDEQEKTKRTLGLAELDAEAAERQIDRELGIVDRTVDRAHEADMTEAGQAHEAGMKQADRMHASNESAADREAQAQQMKLAPKPQE